METRTMIFTLMAGFVVLNQCSAQSRLLSSLTNNQLNFCLNVTRSCPRELGMENLTIYDVFNMMSEEPHKVRQLCFHNEPYPSVLDCTYGVCLIEFRSSKYGYISSMCIKLFQLEWEAECWDSNFPDEAKNCYDYHYPHWRLAAHQFYPTPIRIYDRRTIARDCFPEEKDAHCLFHKSKMLLDLMPTYYEIWPYPDSFNHVDDNIGFTGYTPGNGVQRNNGSRK